MKLGKLTVLSAAALLAGGMSIAVAAIEHGPDAGARQLSRKASAGMLPATPSRTSPVRQRRQDPGGVTTGSAPSGQTNNAKGTGQTGTVAAKQPVCRIAN